MLLTIGPQGPIDLVIFAYYKGPEGPFIVANMKLYMGLTAHICTLLKGLGAL